jgi:glyoxylase-like metal-dependent hydrolase (beta-lactamase superfamily II)
MSLRIHHLNCGTLCPSCERLMNGTGSWSKPSTLVCHCLLIETPEALVLVDTGLGSLDIMAPKARLGHVFKRLMRPQLNMAETAIAQIRALGHDPRDVRHIVTTHLDLDHAGGLADFPEASVHVYKPELNAALHPSLREKARYHAVQFAHQPKWVPHDEQGDSWFGFSSIRAIPGLSTDVLLIPLVGHTRGHTGVAVKNGGRWLLHGGDSYFYRGTLEPAPHMPPGLALMELAVQTDSRQRLHNQTRLRQLAATHRDEVDIFCAHDPVEFARLAGTPD